ncbi:lipase family protein [Nocardia sp. NPDC051900]|uniref:lipase family protein n=1 Tax=Nocardia sp. NPDC051900 TaxID=3364326 RepID=UPI003795520C
MTEPAPADDDGFYAYIPIGPRTSPGKILRVRTIRVPQLQRVKRAWQVVYSTRTSLGEPVPASGIVITPSSKSLNSLLAYCPAFHGLGGRCAPSQLLADGSEPEAGFVSMALERGWTVGVPDGLCLGVTGLGPHHFLAGRAAAHTVLDLVRAAQDLLLLESSVTSCAFWGYGVGGRTAVWAAEQQPRYAPELHLSGVAAGAVIANLRSLLPRLDGGIWSGLGLAGLIGLSRAYAQIPLNQILNQTGQWEVQRAGSLNAATILVSYNAPLGHWCNRPDPWNDPRWYHILANETAGREFVRAPVHLYHGTEDSIVPASMGQELYAKYNSLGVDVNWHCYPASHSGAATIGAAESIDRLTD